MPPAPRGRHVRGARLPQEDPRGHARGGRMSAARRYRGRRSDGETVAPAAARRRATAARGGARNRAQSAKTASGTAWSIVSRCSAAASPRKPSPRARSRARLASGPTVRPPRRLARRVVDARIHLAAERVDERHDRPDERAADAARTSSVGRPTHRAAAGEGPGPARCPARRASPVKEPGPVVTANRSRPPGSSPRPCSSAATAGRSQRECPLRRHQHRASARHALGNPPPARLPGGAGVDREHAHELAYTPTFPHVVARLARRPLCSSTTA